MTAAEGKAVAAVEESQWPMLPPIWFAKELKIEVTVNKSSVKYELLPTLAVAF